MDARRGEIFMQFFGDDGPLKPIAVPLKDIALHLPNRPFRLVGSASNMIVDAVNRTDIEICSSQSAAEIIDVAKFAAQLPNTSEKPKPLYMRSADAKPQKGFAVARVSGKIACNTADAT
jgi:tRNA threonylcarbamoyladenosine biosynthesis protein TsaB